MTEDEYISDVCLQNTLADTVIWLVESSDVKYNVDRHVSLPPPGLSVRSACAAGFELFCRWSDELPKYHRQGIYSEGPILVIDRAWMDQAVDAPPPHILLTLAKSQSDLHAFHTSGHEIEPKDSPIADLLSLSTRLMKVKWGEQSDEHESKGCWLFENYSSEK